MSIKIKYKISDILHDAADKELAHNQQTYWCCESQRRTASLERFSCCAVDNAVTNFLDKKYPDLHWSTKDDIREDIVFDIHKGLKEMGLNVQSTSAFGKEPDELCPDIQGQRYFWLKWAALMAEEQGV
jgi:hypothetical protein